MNKLPMLDIVLYNYNLFSQTEKIIADYLLAQEKPDLDVTISELVEKTDTSLGAVNRFCKKLGFSGFSDFKRYLNGYSGISVIDYQHIDRKDSIHAIKEKNLNYSVMALNETFRLLHEAALEKAVDQLLSAKHIAIVAEGGSSSSARAAYDAFLQKGLNVSLINDPFFQVLNIMNMTSDMVVFVVCHSGRAQNVVEASRFAHESNIPTIGLCGMANAPMMSYIDVPLITGMSKHRFFSDSLGARICELGVISLIDTLISVRQVNEMTDEAYFKHRQKVQQVISMKRID